MSAWGALLGTLAYNYTRHRRGLPTICSVGRRVLHTEHPVGALAFLGAVGLFVDHILFAPTRRSPHVLRPDETVPAPTGQA